MKDINTASFSGYIPRDARFLDGDRPFLSVTVGASDDYKKDDEWVNNTHWVDFIYRGNREKLAEHLVKGTRVWVRYHLEQYMEGEGDDRQSVVLHVIDDLGFIQTGESGGSSERSSSNESSSRSRRQSKSSDGARSRKASAPPPDDEDFDEDIWNS